MFIGGTLMKDMSMCKFISVYYGVALPLGENYIYSHRLMKKHFKLKLCSFKQLADHEDLVATGKIAFIADSLGDVLPYFVPDRKEACTSISDCERLEIIKSAVTEDSSASKYVDEIPVSFEGIETRELRMLYAKYKRVRSFHRKARAELKRRGVFDIKKYKCEGEYDYTKSMRETDETGLLEHPDKYETRQKIKCKTFYR